MQHLTYENTIKMIIICSILQRQIKKLTSSFVHGGITIFYLSSPQEIDTPEAPSHQSAATTTTLESHRRAPFRRGVDEQQRHWNHTEKNRPAEHQWRRSAYREVASALVRKRRKRESVRVHEKDARERLNVATTCWRIEFPHNKGLFRLQDFENVVIGKT